MLDIIRDFESICDRKIPDIIADIGKKTLWFGGVGKAAELLRRNWNA